MEERQELNPNFVTLRALKKYIPFCKCMLKKAKKDYVIEFWEKELQEAQYQELYVRNYIRAKH